VLCFDQAAKAPGQRTIRARRNAARSLTAHGRPPAASGSLLPGGTLLLGPSEGSFASCQARPASHRERKQAMVSVFDRRRETFKVRVMSSRRPRAQCPPNPISANGHRVALASHQRSRRERTPREETVPAIPQTIVALSDLTHPQNRYDCRVPRIPNEWLDSVVYLYPSEEAAERGERAGATGFIVSVPPQDEIIDKDLGHHYIVTNAHTVEKRQSVVARINTTSGGYDVLTIPRSEWETAPSGEDVAAAVLDVEWKRHRYASVNQSMMLTPELQRHWDFGPGDEVFFIGRYIDHEGKTHNVPTVRSGIISAFPVEPINQPERQYQQESILVEARSLSDFTAMGLNRLPSSHRVNVPSGGFPTMGENKHRY
jgi:hypothetical protein